MIVTLHEWAAWAISAVLGAWMLYDMIKTGREYDEEFLTTSVEGTDELFESHTAAETAR
jgi:putative Mn2+ efflux pump MntP